MKNSNEQFMFYLHGQVRRLLTFAIFLLTVTSIYAQGKNITGVITDQYQEPIIGANVVVEGTTNGTMTDIDGKFSLSNVNDQDRLKITFIGYKPYFQNVGNQTKFNIKIEEDVTNIEEVIVVGYGVQKKSDITGALTRVDAKQLKAMPIQNALQGMQGKAAGVDITSNERPGEVGKIYIRGLRSLNATNTPLYVVDGIPMQSVGIENINPTDIESIDILKDASATAIYGSRGANGVVIVTTKRGQKGKTQISYSGTISAEKMYDRLEMMNSGEWLDYARQAKMNAGTYGNNKSQTVTYQDDYDTWSGDPSAWANIEKGWSGGVWNGSNVPTYNWTDNGLKTGITHEHTLSVSGGSDNVQAYTSFGYLKQDGTQEGQSYERYTLKTNVDFIPLKYLKISSSMNVTYGDQEYGYNFRKSATGASSLYFALQGMLPFTVPYDENGDYIRNPGADVNIINPIQESSLCRNNRQSLRAMGSVSAELNFGEMTKILDGFKYRINFGPDFRYGRTGVADAAESINGDNNNVAQYSTDYKFSWTLDNMITYDKKVGKHSLGATFLHSASAYHQEGSFLKSFVNSYDELWYNVKSLGDIKDYSTSLLETSLESWMARLNYSYNDKYLLTASGRWDGASQLAEGNKWDFFPSAALGWRIDQEEFMEETSWIDQLKLRAGVGVTGNSAIDAYGTKGAVTSTFYHFGSATETGFIASDAAAKDPVVMANSKLGWEKTKQYNLGLDISVLGGRVNANIDIFKSTTSDILMKKSLPSVTGYLRTWDNVGETENKGIDITLNTHNIKTKDFNWYSTITFSKDKSEITKLADGITEDIANGWWVGQSIGMYYDYQYDGIWKTSEAEEAAKFGRVPGDIKIKDISGKDGVPDGEIDPNYDRTFVGCARPDWIGGFNNTFMYKNWELSCFIYSRWGFTQLTGAETLSGRFAMRKLDYWIEGINEDAEYYAPGTNGESGDTYKNSMNYQDGSFIKIRNISLGYTFKNIKKYGISNLKIYAQCMNPGLIYSKIDYLDPDLGGSTFNRSFVLGINFSL